MVPVRSVLAVVAVLALLPARGEASPSFARKYDVSCHACHAGAYPELNALGREFKERGFQLPPGAEPGFAGEDTLAPGTVDEAIGLWRDLPLAARLTGSARIPTDPRGSNRNDLDLRLLEDLYLILGGAPHPGVSVFASASVAPHPTLHHAEVGLHDIVGDGALNVRAGDFLLLDFLEPGHRALGRSSNLAANVQAGLNPTVLDSSQLGVDVFGRVIGRRLFYEIAVVQGARGPDGISDLDSAKDLFGQLQLTVHDRLTVGVLGYLGRTQITDTSRQVTVRFTDRFHVVGADVSSQLGPVRIFGYVLQGRHDDPSGTGSPASYVGVRGDVTASITRELLARVRYDAVPAADAPIPQQHVLSVLGTWLLLTNLQLSAQLGADLESFERSTVLLLLDVAI